MSAESVYDYTDICQRIAATVNELNTQIRIAENNKKLYDSYQDKIAKLTASKKTLDTCVNVLKPMLQDTMDYANKRRRETMQSINNALRLAGEIIPDSTEGIFFQIDGNEAWLSTPDSLEVDDVEGGGYRQISSTFLRSVVTAANPDILDFLLLDEMFALVSVQNSTTLSLYLNVITQYMQVISIEQKPQVYSNIDCTMYKFNKVGNYTTVEKIDVKREQNDGGETN